MKLEYLGQDPAKKFGMKLEYLGQNLAKKNIITRDYIICFILFLAMMRYTSEQNEIYNMKQ
jgi:hypothetical protein